MDGSVYQSGGFAFIKVKRYNKFFANKTQV